MRNVLRCLLMTLVSSALCYPVSQPLYHNAQYVSAQAVPSVVYKQPVAQAPGYVQQQQQQQPQYVRAHPVYDSRTREGLHNYASQPLPQRQVQQVILPDRQKPETGPYYFQPLQSAILAAQARDAFVNAQRKEASTHRELQQVPVSLPSREFQHGPVALPTHQQHQRQQPVVREQPLRFISRPVTAQYRVQQQQEEPQQKEQEDFDHNPNYQFGFDVKDDLYTNYQNRKEQRDGNKITGSYSVVDSDGYIRTVQYTADPKEGFKAEVTRQPTDIVVKVPRPDPQFQALPHRQQQPQQYIQEVPVQSGQVDQKQQGLAYRYQ